MDEILREADSHVRRQLRVGERKSSIDRIIKEFCKEEGIKEEEVRNGGQRRVVSGARGQIAYRLNRELGISMAEIARNVGVSTTAVIKATKKIDAQTGRL